jgi:hypothetical protein
MRFNLQMFKSKGGSSTTYNYTPSEEERALLKKQLEYQDAFYPNVIKLNQTAGDVLWDSYGTVQADYDKMNDVAQQQIANAQGIVSGLQSGELPQAYIDNMTNAVGGTVQNTLGSAINSLGQRGVINSSMGNKAISDIANSTANAVAGQYNNNIALQSQLAGQQVDNATAGITASAGAQEASQQPALNLWNASLGLQGSGNQVLGNIAGKYGTRVQSTQNSGGGLGNFLGGAATGVAGNSGFWNYLGGKK